MTTLTEPRTDTERTNLQTIERMTTAFNRKDLESVLACFAEHGVYEDTMGAAPSGHRHQGKAALRALFEQHASMLPHFRFEDLLPVIAGNRGALEYTLVLSGETEQRAKCCDFFELEDGLVTRKSSWIKLTEPVARLLGKS